MTFNRNIPQAADLISVSQGQLLTNNTQLATLFDVDHVTWDDATIADRGKHRAVHVKDQAGDPTTAAGEGAVYNNADDLYFRRASNGDIILLSGGTPSPSGPTQPGHTWLPGGLLMQWDLVSFGLGVLTKVATFSTPFTATPICVTFGPASPPPALSNFQLRVSTFTVNDITIKCTSNNQAFTMWYCAIGNGV